MTQRQDSKKKNQLEKNAWIDIEARSIEQALVKASGALGVTQSDLEYQVEKEDSPKGLFSFFKTPSIIIKARVKSLPSSQSPDRPKAPSYSKEKTTSPIGKASSINRRSALEELDHEIELNDNLPREKIDALIEELRDFCGGIIQRISGEDPKITTRVDEGRLILTSDNDFLGQQITKNSKLAEAMEHILRKKPRHLKQELPFRIFLDVGDMRRKREEELVQMARDLSVKVHENKRPIVLNYKSSYDRKIIHMALDKDDRVYTKSIGSGPNRKLMILPNKYNQKDAESIQPQSPQVINVE